MKYEKSKLVKLNHEETRMLKGIGYWHRDDESQNLQIGA